MKTNNAEKRDYKAIFNNSVSTIIKRDIVTYLCECMY